MDILSIDTDIASSLVSKLNRTGVSINDAKTTMNGGFSRLKGSHNLCSGIEKISNNFSVIGDRFSKLANNINRNANAVVETDLKLAKLADEIVIPEDLKVADSAYKVEVKNTELTKNDGKSVKTGETLKQDYDDSSDVTKENKLENINKGSEGTSKLEEQYTEEKVNLENITKDSSVETENLDDKTKIKKKILEDINSDVQLDLDSLDDTELNKINKKSLEEFVKNANLNQEPELNDANFSNDIDITDIDEILKYMN